MGTTTDEPLDASLQQFLKSFPSRLLTGSTKERILLFNQLNELFIKQKCPDKHQATIVKFILKSLVATLHPYHDRGSRHLVTTAIKDFLSCYDSTASILLSCLNSMTSSFRDQPPSSLMDKTARIIYGWISQINTKQMRELNEQSFQALIGIHINVCCTGLASGRLRELWSDKISIEEYAKRFAAMSDDSLGSLILWSEIFSYALLKETHEELNKLYRQNINDLLVKQIISSKTLVNLDVMSRIKYILKTISHEDFKQSILPSVSRSILRSPEIAMNILPPLLSYLSLDLSQYSEELGKIIGGQLHSKEEQVRNWAILSCKSLAEHTSDSSAIENLIKHFFAVYGGSEGKLTVVEQRLGVISGIGMLSYHSVSGKEAIHSVSLFAVDKFVAGMKGEVNETIVLHMANEMQRFCSRLHHFPDSLISWYKTSIAAKTTTPVVRCAFTSCLVASLTDNSVNDGPAIEALNLLIPVCQKNCVAPIAQVPVVTEGVKAALFLLRAAHFEPKLQNNIKAALSVLTDASKLTLLTEKFISVSSDEGLVSLMSVIERLFIDHESKLQDNEDGKRLFHRVIVLLLSHRSHEVRKKTITACKAIISSSRPFQSSLLHSFGEVMIEAPVSLHSSRNDSREETTTGGETEKNTLFYGQGLSLSLQEVCLVGVNDMAATLKHEVIFNSFIPSHVPIVFHHDRKAWISIIQKLLKVNEIDTFFSKRRKDLLDVISKLDKTSLRQNCIFNLVRFFPDHFTSQLLQDIVKRLQVPDLKTIPKTDYGIYLTPEGVLYETGILDLYKEVTKKQIGRENKLYSVKEQLDEIALRQELEAKKGDKKEPVLNKKQQEAKAAQLEKESVVRSKIALLDSSFTTAIDNLRALLEGNAFETICGLKYLMKPLVNLFSSNLCADRVCQIFTEIGDIVFQWERDASLSRLVSRSTLRQLNPSGNLKPTWNKEDVILVVKKIGSIAIMKESEESEDWAPGFTAPAFSYCFPFLSSALSQLCTEIEHEEEVKVILDIISAHSRLREEDPDIDTQDAQALERSSLRNPRYLPHYDMFNDLFVVLDKVPYNLETDVSVVLREVARSCSGQAGASNVSSDEITRLLSGLVSEKECIRLASLDCLLILSDELKKMKRPDVIHRVYVAQFEESETTAPVARQIWSHCEFSTQRTLCKELLRDVSVVGSALRQSVGVALKNLLETVPEEMDFVFTKLIEMYRKNNKLTPAVVDSFGRPTGEGKEDPWKPRMSVAVVLTEIVQLAPETSVQLLIKFFIPEGLSDRNATVQTQILEAAIKFVHSHGQGNIDALLSELQTFLDTADNSAANDVVRRSVIVLMGNLAKHLDKDDERVKPIVVKLIESLSTPSQLVQEAAANCLPALVPSFREEAPDLVKSLMKLLFTSENYGERKGAAYGIAGLVKGLGILSLKQLEVMDQLMDCIQDKNHPRRREGALFAFEMLCIMLGRLFEPYIIHVVPHLLLCYGDKDGKVRKAADDASKAVMMRLSGHGVKLVLPSLLEAIEQDAWRTKVGSVTLLGNMSYCAPKQLSTCLPSIVPKLVDNVLCDSHPAVQNAGSTALRKIGSVIRNPEIQAIVPVIIQALEDPANKTNKCLEKMLSTKFVHFIDAPSLALIMPVIERAFNSRSTGTRKMAAQIIGNMYSLTDQKDLSPYLSSVLPGLKASLIDPVPEVRGVASRALGAMVKGMGEGIVQEIMPWLLDTLTSEGSSVDRSGAAQGLAEVIGSLGLIKLNKFMPEIISTAERTDVAPHVRDGYLMLLIYLPMVFNKDFIPHIGKIVSPLLKALADENEFVRETALRAGQRVVNMYADSAVQFLLPELELGLFDDNWRIRLSSVQLLGDLLYKILGVSGKMTTESAHDDDTFGTEQSQNAIGMSLGLERRNRVFSGLYMGRCDVSPQVSQSALHVWKVVVDNTPRTLKEILPTLFGFILSSLASNNEERQQVAARTLGDLVRKLGERVLPEMIPILEQGLKSDQADQRQGVCIGLSEMIASTSRNTVQAFAASLVPTVTKALYDPNPEVRTAAGKTFESLHSTVGVRVLDEILPKMLKLLGDPVQGENALDGLKQIMTTKGKVVLPYLIPQLTAHPVNTRALSLLAPVAGDALSKHLTKILPALLTKLSNSLDTSEEKKELEYCQVVILAVNDDLGIRSNVDYLLEGTKSQDVKVRRAAVMLIHAYSCQARNISPYVSSLLRGLIFLFTDTQEDVLSLVWEAINSITKSLDTKAQMNLVSDVRSAIRYAVSDSRSSPKSKVILPGLSLSKGIAPILPVFREAILNGSPEQKELASQGLSELIEVTSPEALKSSVINIAGPLIRILGDRHAWSVKVSVLDTLSLLLEKAETQLKPFLPQLQQTFLKGLEDSQKQVRLKSAHALSHLVRVHSKCDSLVQKILSLVKGDDISVRETALFALRLTLLPAGDKISDDLSKTIISTVTSLLSSTDDATRVHAAACLGTLCKWVPSDDLNNIIKNYLLRKDSSDWTLNHGCAVSLRVALKVAPEKLAVNEWTESLIKALGRLISSDRIPLVINGLKGTAYFFRHEILEGHEINSQLLTAFARAMNHSSNEVKMAVSSSCVFLSKSLQNALPVSVLKSLVPLLVNGTKEKNTMVKSGSEQALISVLRLRREEETASLLVSSLDPGPKEALQDCIQKVLKRVMSQPEPKEEEFDDTLAP